MSCKSRQTLYIGVTTNLQKRVDEHKNHKFPNSFSNKYNCVDLVYYEVFASIEEAILREKQLKGWSRNKKENLIAEQNPEFLDLNFPC